MSGTKLPCCPSPLLFFPFISIPGYPCPARYVVTKVVVPLLRAVGYMHENGEQSLQGLRLTCWMLPGGGLTW